MSKITRLERIRTTSMEPMLDGSYQEHVHDSWAWRCDGCGLVWDRKHHAAGCEARGHKARWDEGPYGVTMVLNGVPQGNLRYYTRQALRREAPAAVDVSLAWS